MAAIGWLAWRNEILCRRNQPESAARWRSSSVAALGGESGGVAGGTALAAKRRRHGGGAGGNNLSNGATGISSHWYLQPEEMTDWRRKYLAYIFSLFEASMKMKMAA